MNPTNEPTHPNIPPLPTPLSPDASLGTILQVLLRRPAQLVTALESEPAARLPWLLGIFALLTFAGYGVVVGSFSGGLQWVAAPLKVSVGALASAAICLPSLFIFLSLSGAEVTLRAVIGTLCAALALMALMLVGLVPVAWVFSASTDSVAFIGALHLLFWLIAVFIGLRLPRQLLVQLGVRERLHFRVWTLIFLFVGLQMTTALRPIVGSSDHWLSTDKKFFVAYWLENITSRSSANHD